MQGQMVENSKNIQKSDGSYFPKLGSKVQPDKTLG